MSSEPPNSQPYVVILAGGSGTRFWPLSRHQRPKQLLPLFGDETLLGQTHARLNGLVPDAHVLVLTNKSQEAAVRAALPMLPPDNILAEPEKRDTAPAIALAIGWVARLDPSATMIVLPADQLIRDTEGFQDTLRDAVGLAQRSHSLVTVGVKPTWACPSYGYLELGERFTPGSGPAPHTAVYSVARFREKPNAELAETFVAAGNFAWNAGMFIWTLPTVMSDLARHCAGLADFVNELRRCSDFGATVAKQFGKLEATSIDYALMEQAKRVLNIEAGFDWDDVGSWISVGKYHESDSHGNSRNCEATVVDSHNNIVFSKLPGHIALLGVNDLIVVQTGDALLVAHRSQAEKIKHLTAKVPDHLL